MPRSRAWEALNDLDVLKHCMPGCQSLDRQSEERIAATLAMRVGPIGARFIGTIALLDVEPPRAYTMTWEGQGGTAGMVSGSARVCLADEGDGTLLTYEVDVRIGGRLAQLGGPIIDATAKQFASSFFKRFGERIVEAPAATTAGTREPVSRLQSGLDENP